MYEVHVRHTDFVPTTLAETRPPIFSIHATSDAATMQIQIALNIVALAHRAIERLHYSDSVQTAWRLTTHHAKLASGPLPKFRLLSNADDPAFPLSRAISYLKYGQPRSLYWMKKQEQGKIITVTEVEEAVNLDLGWRVEARAQVSLTISGGVLADLPSFGYVISYRTSRMRHTLTALFSKTVTSIALLQSEYEQHTPDELIQNNRKLKQKLPMLVDSAATLIVCPPHIALQWNTELRNFLSSEQYDVYDVRLIQSFGQLQKLGMDDLQKSRVIVVSWSVFAEPEYISHIADFTAMPEPSISGRRAFETWFNRAMEEVPDQLAELQSTTYEAFRNLAESKRVQRSKDDAFNLTLPITIQHGSAYKSFEDMQTSLGSSMKNSKNKHQTKPKTMTPSHQAPLLHLFRFNRVIIDEYHYLNTAKGLDNVVASVNVKQIAAYKRWLLSAMGNFSDVDQIASYLGIKLGRHCVDDSPSTARANKGRQSEATLVEDLLAQTEVRSRQWHEARHQRAQEFLDLFVRQNSASLQHITCTEKIVPVEMDIGHHAVYLELSQHLISQKMQIKKLNNKKNSDRIDRLNASLENSE